MKKYIAYGSNLSMEQMAYRCRDARVIGKATILGWKLVFRQHATIEPEEGSEVPVLLWEISKEDERRLDVYEGFPMYYYKTDMDVVMTELDGKRPRKVKAMVYLMEDGHPIHLPTPSYYQTLLGGYERFGFDTELLERAMDEANQKGRW